MERIVYSHVKDIEERLKIFAAKICVDLDEQREWISFMMDPLQHKDVYLSCRQKLVRSNAGMRNALKLIMDRILVHLGQWERYGIPYVYGMPMKLLTDMVHEDMNRIETDLRNLAREGMFSNPPDMQKLEAYKGSMRFYARIYGERKSNPFSQYFTVRRR